MEENKKALKIKLPTFIMIIAFLVIAMLGIFIYIQKVNSNKKIEQLQNETASLQTTISELQGKLGDISNIATDEEDKKSNTQKNTSTTDTKNTTADTNNSNAEKKSRESDRSKAISKYKEVIASYNYDTGWVDNMYAVYDIDKDSIPELFIYTLKTNNNVIDAYTTVFKYDISKNDTINVGKIDGRIDSNTAIYMMNDGRLLAVYGHLGFEKTTYYSYKNGKLTKEETSKEREIGEGEDYIKGDKLIDFIGCKNTSLIDNYK